MISGEASSDATGAAYPVAAGGYGGLSHNLAESQDWSSYQGLRFWWYASQSNNPASPTAGADIKVEIKDGNPAGASSQIPDRFRLPDIRRTMPGKDISWLMDCTMLVFNSFFSASGRTRARVASATDK